MSIPRSRSSTQRGADPAGVERQRNPSRRPAHGYTISFCVFLFASISTIA